MQHINQILLDFREEVHTAVNDWLHWSLIFELPGLGVSAYMGLKNSAQNPYIFNTYMTM